ncbi:hypothetical protein PI125_g23358 [Phytophthora idaei]|nr:hypothetical protein PI125_g23358 [Phytophthora idaei]
MPKGVLNRTIDRAFKALAPRRAREHERLQVCYPIFTFNPRPCAHHVVPVSVNLVRATPTIQTLSNLQKPRHQHYPERRLQWILIQRRPRLRKHLQRFLLRLNFRLNH